MGAQMHTQAGKLFKEEQAGSQQRLSLTMFMLQRHVETATQLQGGVLTALLLACASGGPTIVTHEPHGLSQRPLGGCVGGETPVVHGKGGGVGLVLQVLVELAQSCRLKHALHPHAGPLLHTSLISYQAIHRDCQPLQPDWHIPCHLQNVPGHDGVPW